MTSAGRIFQVFGHRKPSSGQLFGCYQTVDLQTDFDCIYCVVDSAITVPQTKICAGQSAKLPLRGGIDRLICSSTSLVCPSMQSWLGCLIVCVWAG